MEQQRQQQQQETAQTRQNSLNTSHTESPFSRSRTISATLSEKAYQGLLENMPTALTPRCDRSDSDSSGTSIHTQHPIHLSPVSLVSPSITFSGGSGTAGGDGDHSPGLGKDLMLLDVKDFSENTNTNALIRNNSHSSSVGSISPVIIRQNYNCYDIPQHGFLAGQIIQQNGVANIISGSPTENAGIGGSPSNRSKRSSDSIRISTPELEAVPERDENTDGANQAPFRLPRVSQPVSFGLDDFFSNTADPPSSTSSVAHDFSEFFSQPLVNHRRYNSLPATDSGYSVIKDITSTAVGRERASTVSDSTGGNVETYYFELGQHLNEGCELGGRLLQISLESQYQEIDAKKENPYSTIGGRHGRRRSSSLSDLQRSKCNSRTPHFENVYEDVDELKETMKKLLREEPPELPARPLSVSFSSPPTQVNVFSKPRADTVGGTATKTAKKKRFLFGKNKQGGSLDSENSDTGLSNGKDSNVSGNVCTCKSTNSDILALSTPFAPCSQCAISKASPKRTDFSSSFKSHTSRTFSSSTEELIHASDSSSFSELYADITEIRAAQGKRRRSSDITPVKQNLLDMEIDSFKISQNHGKNGPLNDRATTHHQTSANLDDNGEQKPPALPQRRPSPPSKSFSTDGGDLIQLIDNIINTKQDKTNIYSTIPTPTTGSRTITPKVAPHQPPPASDPLISFFLDDNMFQDNPMVTGILPASKPKLLPQVLEPNNKAVPFCLDTLHTSSTNPFSTSFSTIDFRDSNNNSSTSPSSTPSPSTNLNDVCGERNAPNFTNPFAGDLFLTAITADGPLHSPVSGVTEENYLAMTTGGKVFK
ncbi:hypothetical protein ElyMa_004222200 [Elysia marginata]|uniref:Uncharacterized protein n=1 Tax=Elysia marginata TaxID=1093978 RepID=A0AAV4GS99_9GAST|nr:hypothetical protein ElyMa_004222200 [Elysia marginata]